MENLGYPGLFGNSGPGGWQWSRNPKFGWFSNIHPALNGQGPGEDLGMRLENQMVVEVMVVWVPVD